ncbi:TetR/AcrR family transcriptional regulator [Streptomyces sp. NPDC058417]|uniref:TetR/AcrR family transcriptional regulator n=1 Tax=unclassified Streptomyces TaxID=2593676 RepID=UPI003647714A
MTRNRKDPGAPVGRSDAVCLRVDAARNRSTVLRAAAELFAEHGVDQVSMEQVAAAAGVGKATLFRHFGSRSGLAAALLDTCEGELRDAVLAGPPPLGPDAPPAARLAAFLGAYADHVVAHLDLARAAETGDPGTRYRNAPYLFWHRHVRDLLAEAPGVDDPDATAHGLLAPLAADRIAGLLPELGSERIRAGVLALARAATTSAGRAPAAPGADPVSGDPVPAPVPSPCPRHPAPDLSATPSA